VKIAADVAAGLMKALPSRLVAKLDADPAMASRWKWDGDGVETDKGERVRLQVEAGIVRGVTCSCLLSPKCLHVAAVVATLEPAETAATVAAAPEPAAATAFTASPAAARAFAVCADVLATGAEATGAVAQAELLRAIHACRSDGLHRLAAAQTRVLRSVRDLRADRPEFALATLAADLREALLVASQLATGAATPELVGRARRDYEAIGNLRLRGVFTEAIVARTGYAGAVTYLADERGALYTRADVMPGDVGRAAGAYDAAAGIGDAVLPHRALCRAGLFVSDATASADGRLGAGKAVRAARAQEPSQWTDPGIAARWQRSLDDQLAAIAAADAAVDGARPAGWDLVFVDGAVFGAVLVVGDRALELATALEQPMLAARDNLGVLARAPGLRVRAIGRVRLALPGRIELLAIAPADGETRLAFPEAWQGRANVHYDRLAVPSPTGAQASGAASVATVVAAPAIRARPVAGDLLEPLRRRLERVALGGLVTLPVHALPELERDAAVLADRALRAGADALRGLGAFAATAERTMTGERRAVDRGGFARAWLRAAVYDDAARRRLAVASW
jgi:hypothetical protein